MIGKPNSWCKFLPALFFGGFAWMAMTSGASPVFAQEDTAALETEAAPAAALLGAEQLRRVVAPVAFYSDDLLAIVLPASTSPLQIVEAQRFLNKSKKDQKLEPNAEWDPSILALINYPEVIEKMNADLEWTKALGNAVIEQLVDVMDMIQQLRAEAAGSGYLQANEFQVVYWLDDHWYIDSSDPDYIYIPDYPPDHPIFNPPGVRPEHPIALPPDVAAPRPEQPIALPPGAIAPQPEHPIAYPPPPYAAHQPYWSPGATFVAGAILGGAFGYGFDWNNSEIDINVGADCCRGGNVGIGSGNRVDHHAGDRLNADKQWANGKDKLKWNGNKARQKQTQRKQKAAGNVGTLPARNNKGSATTKRVGAGSSKLKNPYVGDSKSIRGNKNKSAMGNYQSGRDSYKSRNQGNRSLERKNQQRSGSQQRANQNRSRQKAGAFGGYGNGSRTARASNRGGSSVRSSRGGGARGGGRR